MKTISSYKSCQMMFEIAVLYIAPCLHGQTYVKDYIRLGGRVIAIENPAGTSGGQLSAVSVVPASGSGRTQTFTFTFSDTAGWQQLGVLDVLINSAIDSAGACYLAYSPASNTLDLVDDAGDGGFAGTMLLPSSGSISNSQCTINGSGSSVSGSGNNLNLALNITFKSPFAGDNNISGRA